MGIALALGTNCLIRGGVFHEQDGDFRVVGSSVTWEEWAKKRCAEVNLVHEPTRIEFLSRQLRGMARRVGEFRNAHRELQKQLISARDSANFWHDHWFKALDIIGEQGYELIQAEDQSSNCSECQARRS
jgi:hypothetical protein